jgi:hypothetical protein
MAQPSTPVAGTPFFDLGAASMPLRASAPGVKS